MRVPFVCFLVLCFGLCAGCNTPSLDFAGVPPARLSVNGSTFDVRVRGTLAEAIRVNAEYAPRFGPIRPRAEKAIELVSGCRVKKIAGDQALITARLTCPETRATPGVAEGCARTGTARGKGVGKGRRGPYPTYHCAVAEPEDEPQRHGWFRKAG